MKKPLLLLVCSFLICPVFVHAQKKIEGHWGKKFMDVAYSAAAANDGGYILTGLTQSGSDTTGDIVVIKLSAQGDTQWTFTYGGPKLEGGNNVIQTADGGYLVSGHTEDFGAQDCDAFLMKMDKNGNRDWLKVYGGEKDDIGEGVIELPGGGYIFAGITASWGNTDNSERRHVYFVRTNAGGDVLWTKYYAGKDVEYGYSIAPVYDGGFLAVGYSSSWGHGETDGWILRLNASGDTLWTRLYQNNGDSKFYKILPTADNGFIVAGYTTQGNNSKPQGLVIKLDADGNKLWEKLYGTTNQGILLRDAAQLPDGNLMFTGVSYTADTTGNAYVLTTDVVGVRIAEMLCGGGYSASNCIAVQGNNSYLVAGISPKYGDSYGDIYYMEIDNTVSNVPTIDQGSAHVYPNPVKDQLCIILPSPEAYQPVNIDITNMKGQVVLSKENLMAKDIVIDRSVFPNGPYVFSILCRDGKVYKGKFIVN